MDPWNVEVAEEHDHVTTDERHIEIAGSRTVRIERFVRTPLVSGNRAAAKYQRCSVRCLAIECIYEFIEAIRIATECELRNAFANLALPVWIQDLAFFVGAFTCRCVCRLFFHGT